MKFGCCTGGMGTCVHQIKIPLWKCEAEHDSQVSQLTYYMRPVEGKEKNEGDVSKMFKLLNKKKNNKGFTLVELVIVIAILAILVGLLAPQYTKYVEKSRRAADVDNLDEMVKAVQVYEADTDKEGDEITQGQYTINLTTDGVTAEGLEDALAEYLPDYDKKTLKSKKWGDNGISAVIDIDDKGNITVSYDPDDLKQQ